MLRPYNAKSISTCLASGTGRDAVVIGDSTAREVFWAMARKLNATAANTQMGKTVQKHADITFVQGTTTLSFKWDPFLSGGDLSKQLEASRGNAKDPGRPPLPLSKGLVVVGAGLWFAREKPRPVDEFKKAMDKIMTPFRPPHTQDVLDSPGTNPVYFLPVVPPFYDLLDEDHKTTLRKSDIVAMNKYMHDLPTIHGVDVLESFLHMVGESAEEAYQPNGLHVSNTVSDRMADVVYNLKCNEGNREYPFVGTCCYTYPQAWDKTVFLGVGTILLAILGWFELQEWVGTSSEGSLASVKDHLPLLRAVLVMWAALVYCYLADRTHLFDKIQKLYNNQDFFIFTAAILAVGSFSLRRSSSPTRPGQEKHANVDQPFLSRDQTDEWKGWMQLFILAYHYTGASQVLWIYKYIRLCVASYLFMTGYGHASYFYTKNDFSLKRVVAVNIRINLLSMLLPWITNADYLFYYFAPLVTYWYAIIYIVMRVKSDWNQNLSFFLTKVAVACTCTTLLHTQPWLIDPVFRLINAVFGSKWEAKEWFFRCALDQFIVYVGMIVAVLYIRNTKTPAPPAPPLDALGTTAPVKAGLSPELNKNLYMAGSAISIVTYAFVASFGTTKTSSNALHTFISPLAILSFIHIRNCTPLLRNYYSAAWAWIGKISLETFVLQYHIWLAADTKGLLSLGIFGRGSMPDGGSLLTSGMGLARWADCLLLGVVFIWISSHVAAATGDVSGAIVKALFK